MSVYQQQTSWCTRRRSTSQSQTIWTRLSQNSRRTRDINNATAPSTTTTIHFRRTGPREGEIQIDCRRNGHHFRRIGWLLKNTNHAKEKEKHQRFFINYIPAHLPSDVLFSYTHQQQQLKKHYNNNNNIEQPHTCTPHTYT
jgi:hypothetical protein